MLRFIQYYSQFQEARGNFGGLPGWAHGILFILAIPGLALAALSILMLCISILALLLLTVPAYRLLRAVAGSREIGVQGDDFIEGTVVSSQPARTPRIPIDVKILE